MFLPVRRVQASSGYSQEQALAWPFVLPPVRQLMAEGLDLGRVTVIAGENGTGKSTLVEGIAMAFGLNAEGGSTGAMHATRNSESQLPAFLELQRGAAASRRGFFLRSETMHSFYSYLEQNCFRTRLHERSHGESFLDLVAERIPVLKGLWVLDEPESALSLNGCVKPATSSWTWSSRGGGFSQTRRNSSAAPEKCGAGTTARGAARHQAAGHGAAA